MDLMKKNYWQIRISGKLEEKRMLVPFKLNSRMILVAVFVFATYGCTKNGFTGDKLDVELPAKEEAQPEEKTPVIEYDPVPLVSEVPMSEFPTQVLPTVPVPLTPQPSVVPAPGIATVPPATLETAKGMMSVGVMGIVNMDSRHQITNDGYCMQVRQGNDVLASSNIDLRAIMNGEPLDLPGGALAKPYLLRMNSPNYISPSITSGILSGDVNANVSICLPQAGSSCDSNPVNCQDLNQAIRHANGINTISNSPAIVNIANASDVVVKQFTNLPRRAGDYCTSANGMPCVAIAHSAVSGAVVHAGALGRDDNSPLVLDMNNNGKMDLKSAWVKKPVKFDFTASGKKLKSGWIKSSEAFLAVDSNLDGVINNGSELFGEYTFSKDGSKTFENGFAALSRFDSDKNGVINKKDAKFAKILVWQDRNGDGLSQKSELKKLSSAKIAQINLAYKVLGTANKQNIIAGNNVALGSTFEFANGKKSQIADVWFEIRMHRSINDIVAGKRK